MPPGQERLDGTVVARRRIGRNERDLALIGRAALMLDPQRLADSLDDVLEMLRRATRADSAECFLLRPDGLELLLTLHRGCDAATFAEISRFSLADGYPGLAVQTNAAVQTSCLDNDERFLRSGVKAAGYKSFISMPIGAAGRVLGTLNLGWKRDDVDFERVGRVLAGLGSIVGSALLASAAAWVGPNADVRGDLRERLRTLTAADVALLRLGPPSNAEVGPRGLALSSRDMSLADCAPVREVGLAVLEGDSVHWPEPCLERCGPAKVRYCLPLERGGVLQGIARLSYTDHVPLPLTRYVAPSLGLIEAWRGPRPPALGPPPAAVQPPVEIRCFGSFEVHLDGEPLPRSAFARRKAVELLQLLVLKPGRTVAGSQLARLLWPGVEPEAAKNRLHGVVYALRKALGPNKDKSAVSWLVCENDRYSLALPAGASVDLWRFRDAIAKARTAEAQGDSERAARAHLQAALDLYRGDLFAGVEDAVWTIDPRSRFRERCIDVLLRLDRYRRALDGNSGDVSLLRRAVAVDPLREDIHLRLIRTLLEGGRRVDAMDQYGSLVRVLREQLDSRPSEEARRLRRQIRAEEPRSKPRS